MTRLVVSLDDPTPDVLERFLTVFGVDPSTSARILEVSPGNASVEIPAATFLAPAPAPAAPTTREPGWTADRVREFVWALRPQAFTVLGMLLDTENGVITLDDALQALGLTNGKALGGVMSSFGHNLFQMAKSGALPMNTHIVSHDKERREFRLVVTSRVRAQFSRAVAARREEERTLTPPQLAESVA